MTNMTKLYIIAGPTASGKTAAGIALAHQLDGEVISADSMQVYQGMDIGTAKPATQEMEGIPHHMLDVVAPEENFSVKEYQQQAREKLADIIARGKAPIIVGGTGFYINALIYNNNFETAGHADDLAYREKYNQYAIDHGPEKLHEILQKLDPAYAQTLHPNNVKKVVRAISFCKSTGRLFSDYNQAAKAVKSEYALDFTVIDMDRAKLYDRINQRVDIMWQQGLLEEVEKFKHLDPTLPAMQGIGYKEVLAYINSHATKDQTLEAIKQNTRNYAKRQITWFKHQVRV